jgi:hypothetical protein
MAVAKSGKGGNQEGKSLGKMSGEKASGLSRVDKPGLADQGEDEIMEVGHDFCAMADPHTSSIFSQGNVSTIMRTGFDTPMSPANFQQPQGSGLFACETGDPEFSLARGLIAPSFTLPLSYTTPSALISCLGPIVLYSIWILLGFCWFDHSQFCREGSVFYFLSSDFATAIGDL